MKAWVLVTRAAQDVAELTPGLPEGLELFAYPVLRLVPWEEPERWEEVRQRLNDLELVAVTSPRTPEPLKAQAVSRGMEDRLLRLPAAAVGEATAAACRKVGLAVVLVGTHGGAALAREIAQRLVPPAGILFPCGREHREELPAALQSLGFSVLPLPVYAMEATPQEELPPLPETPPLAVVCTSPRAARLYWLATGGRWAEIPHLAWGPTTAQELETLGVKPQVLGKPNPQSLKEALCQIS